ncbi:MAG TPA: hypothetical protein PK903_06295 [Paludibacteraceae bacterium]|nr:hypothetical protein [Paludibacteraceae bacterium]NLJ20462.1 hypothetical protein [Bacteroidales bacterium]HNZ61757.1 hypothetical protein [Paludibacteraceae bacterium]HOH55707.1 hypothetical protein [Paludibacteraceae bacterium]
MRLLVPTIFFIGDTFVLIFQENLRISDADIHNSITGLSEITDEWALSSG